MSCCKTKRCVECGVEIIKERMEALPETSTCASCSRVEPKTTKDVEVDVPDAMECLKQMSNQGD